MKGSINAVQLMLESDCDLYRNTGKDGNALQACAWYGNPEIATALIQHGSQINGTQGRLESALHSSSWRGNLNMVKFLLAHGADIHEQDEKGKTALRKALKWDRLDIVKHIVDHAAATNQESPVFNFDHELCRAIENGDTDTAALFLNHGADPHAIVNFHYGPIRHAVKSDSFEFVKLLIAHGVDANAIIPSLGRSPFMSAIEKGNLDHVKFLIDSGANSDGQGECKGFPLWLASKGPVEIVRLLIDHGADASRYHKGPGSALERASGEGQLETVKLLISKGAPVNHDDFKTSHPLQSAAKYGHLDVARYLLANGADNNARIAALHAAVSMRNMEMMALLIDHLPHPDISYDYLSEALRCAVWSKPVDLWRIICEKGSINNHWQDTPSDEGCAVWKLTEPTAMVRFLIEKGANVDAQDDQNSTALIQAVRANECDVVKLLLEKGADPNARDKCGTALLATLQTNHLYRRWDTAKSLIDCGADVNEIDDRCGTLLEMASTEVYLDIVELLIKKGADVEHGRGKYGSALIAASCSSQDHPRIVDLLLLQKGFNIEEQHPVYGSALSAASKRGHVKVVERLLKSGAGLNNTVQAHGSALRAAFQGSFEEAQRVKERKSKRKAYDYPSCRAEPQVKVEFASTIELLVQKGAVFSSNHELIDNFLQAAMSDDLDAMKMTMHGSDNLRQLDNEVFNAVLWIASCKSKVDIVRLLFTMGPDGNPRNLQVGQAERYSLALKSALSRRHFDIASFLIEKGANAHIPHLQLQEYLYFASADGYFEVLKFMLGKYESLKPVAELYSGVLVAASAGGYYAIADFLIEKGADLNAPSKGDWTALSAASSQGQYQLVELLIAKGADVNATTEKNGSPLLAASARSHRKIVQLLISKGADVNATHEKHGCALHAAISREDHELIDLLLGYGADVNAHGGNFGNALHLALTKGYCQIARRLIQKGADINAQGGRFGDVLQATLSVDDGWTEDGPKRRNMALFLIEIGADIHTQGGQYGNPLLAALSNSHYYVAEVLIRKGADINSRAGIIDKARLAKLIDEYQCFEEYPNLMIDRLDMGNNAAISALMGGYPDKARELVLHHEKSFVASASEYCAVLFAAIIRGNIALATLLLDRAEDSVLSDNVVNDLLLTAITCRKDVVAKALIDRGANVNAQDGDGHSALQVAVLTQNFFMMKILIEKSADINASSTEHGTVLQTVITILTGSSGVNDHIDLIDYLIERGADLNVQGGQFGNALQAAIQIHISKDSGWSYGGDEDARVHENEFEDPIFGLVRMLIEKGADINAQGGEYGNALQAALCLGKPGIARFLIRKGADVHMLGGKHGNMIQAALSGGCRDLAEVLIRQGVDVNANDGFDEAISTALSKGYDNIVNLLLEDCKGPNLTDEELDSSLQEAVLEGDVDSAKGLTNLIVRFSEPGSRQRKLNDAVAAALAHGHHDIFGFLVGKGAKIDLEAFRRCADV